MTVNRRTKKATNRQPADSPLDPNTQAKPSQAVTSKSIASKAVESKTVESKAVEVAETVIPLEEATPEPPAEAKSADIEPATAPVVAEVSTPPAVTQSTTEGSPAMSQEEEAVKVEPKPVKAKAPKGEIVRKSPSLSIWDRPVMPDQFEIIGTLQMAGERPVAASVMTVFDTYLNGRPIESSSLKLYDELPGSSPIFFSDFHSVEGLDLPGGRPVMASPAGLMASEKLPGDRPIFSNEIDNPYELMGYLD